MHATPPKQRDAKIYFVLQLPLDKMDYNGEDLVIGIGMLLSWSPDMGIAQLQCMKGCTCNPAEFSAFSKEGHYSMTHWNYFSAKVPLPQPLQCVVKLGVDQTENYQEISHYVVDLSACHLQLSA